MEIQSDDDKRRIIRGIITNSIIDLPSSEYTPHIVEMFNPVYGWSSIFERAKLSGILTKLIFALDRTVVLAPQKEQFFEAFRRTPFDATRIVILGQDPYPGKDSKGKSYACGASFAIDPNCSPVPPSLANIKRESNCTDDNDLMNWTKQGVFLLNASITLHDSSDTNPSIWTSLIKLILSELAMKKKILFFLWGTQAKYFEDTIQGNGGIVLTAGHPASRNISQNSFEGCAHFDKANAFFRTLGENTIRW